MDVSYTLTLVDGSTSQYQCETLDVTPTTVTGINTLRVVVFVAPVSQIKLLRKD
jgi:hypothetical protein